MVDVVYVAGQGRSGSTIFGNVLGEHRDFFHAGEVRYLWKRGVEEDRLCGCGVPFSRCAFWTRTMERAFGGRDGVDTASMRRWVDRLRALGKRGFSAVASAARRDPGEFAAQREILGRLYAAIREVSGCAVVVDSSKSPYYLFALAGAPQIRAVALHLVRDPRAVAFSLLRRKAQPDPREPVEMTRFRAHQSALRWNWINRDVGAACRQGQIPYARCDYGEFVSRPAEAVRRVHGLAGISLTQDVFGGGRCIELGENHGVWGNPSRFARGPTELRSDDEWRSRMPWLPRAVVTALTRRQRRHYGY